MFILHPDKCSQRHSQLFGRFPRSPCHQYDLYGLSTINSVQGAVVNPQCLLSKIPEFEPISDKNTVVISTQDKYSLAHKVVVQFNSIFQFQSFLILESQEKK